MTFDRSAVSVLVVDDVEASRYALSRVLRANGFKTVEASAGAQALELGEYFSAVVLDVHLPDLHGFEVCRLLRSKPGCDTLPIIHVSAVYVRPEDREAGEQAGADAYLVAPVDPQELSATIERLVQARARH